MTSVVRQYQVVDPDRLVVATHQESDGRVSRTVAVFCRYAPATDAAGHRVMAVEIVYDPHRQTPNAPYRVPVEALRRLVLSPRALVRVEPYTIA